MRKDFKLRFNGEGYKPLFYVNKEKGIVSCKLEAGLLTPYSYDIFIPETRINGVGIAKCGPNDTFDIVRGKKIALAKAENNAYNNALKYLKEYRNNILDMLNKMVTFENKSDAQCTHNIDYIEGLSDVEHPHYKENVNDIKVGKTIYVG